MDIVGSTRSAFTWAKLGRFQVFGTIIEGPNRFEGTKVHVREGLLRPGRFVLPAGLLALFREKAEHAGRAVDSISESQFEKIDRAVMANIDKFVGSPQLAAMMADASMFGEEAILRRRKPKEDNS